jgi:hypothetical protein
MNTGKDIAASRSVETERNTMRNVVARLVVGVAITSIAMFGADNSIGTWKRNIEQSKSTSPSTSTSPITSLTVLREALDGGVQDTVTGQRKDGTAINSVYTAKYDGKPYQVTGAPYDTISIKQIDSNNFTSEAKKTGGKYHVTGRMIISKDGKTMTQTTKGIDADGKPSNGTYIYDKQ